MKKIFLLIIAVIFLPYIYDKILSTSPSLQKSLPPPLRKSSQSKKVNSVNFNGQTYSYTYFSPSPSQQMIYNLNLSEKFTSLDIIKSQGCTHLINGGFYDKLYQPIGLVIKDGLEVSPSQKNSLFNGFLSSTSSAKFKISTSEPSLNSVVAIQTGPILISNSIANYLSLKTDEYKRRMVLMTDVENVPYFLVITLSESDAEGPLLETLPKLVKQVGSLEKINISEAINLDGGSASTFYTPDIHIKEISTIGSYLCFK